MILFLSIFLSLYGLLNIWLFWQLRSIWPEVPLLRRILQTLFWLGASGFVLGRCLEKWHPSWISWTLIAWGGVWFAVVAYSLLFFLISGAANLFLHGTGLLPSIKHYLHHHRKPILRGYALAIALLLLGGWINAITPRLHEITLDLPSSRPRPPLRLILVTDLHLGTLIGRDSAVALTRRINAWHPDAILLGGDTLDEDIKVLQLTQAGEPFRTLHAPLGVWGITGNHEFFGGADKGSAYLEEQGVQMLRDRAARLRNDGIWLIGREDYSSRRFGTPPRQSLAALIRPLPEGDVTIVLDHQPIRADEAAREGVALQLSGHTHHGQLWPAQWIVDRVFPVARGLVRLDHSWVYVSSGYGTWGPRIRTNARPEMVGITLRFNVHAPLSTTAPPP